MRLPHGIVWLVLGALLALPAGAARAHSEHEHRHGEPAKPAVRPSDEVKVSPATLKLPELPLVNQDGVSGVVASDWVGDRIVVIDFIFTTCPLVCPLLSAVMASVQERIGDAAGTEVRLISISVDPATDIPPRLKDYAKKYDAGPGWSFLTGEKPVVDRVLKAFGAYSPDFADHAPMFLVGDAREGRWTRLYGFPTPERIVAMIDEYRSARAARRDSRAR